MLYAHVQTRPAPVLGKSMYMLHFPRPCYISKSMLCPCPCLCCMSMCPCPFCWFTSILYDQVLVACLGPCCMSMPISMLYVHLDAACYVHDHSSYLCPCCMSMSMLHAHVHAPISIPVSMPLSVSMLHVDDHVACTYPWCMSMSMLLIHIRVHSAYLCPIFMSMSCMIHVHAAFPWCMAAFFRTLFFDSHVKWNSGFAWSETMQKMLFFRFEVKKFYFRFASFRFEAPRPEPPVPHGCGRIFLTKYWSMKFDFALVLLHCKT